MTDRCRAVFDGKECGKPEKREWAQSGRHDYDAELCDHEPDADCHPFVSSCAEYTTCEGDESNCEYSRTNCNVDGSFRCLRHDFETKVEARSSCAEAPRCLDCGKSQNERGVPAICDTWHTVVDAPKCKHGWDKRMACTGCQAEYDAPSAAPRDEQDLVTMLLSSEQWAELVSEMDRLRADNASLAKPAREGGTNEPLLTDDEIKSRVIEYHIEGQRPGPTCTAACLAYENGIKWARDTITKRIQERREA